MIAPVKDTGRSRCQFEFSTANVNSKGFVWFLNFIIWSGTMAFNTDPDRRSLRVVMKYKVAENPSQPTPRVG